MDQYSLEHVIGEGTYGIVYRAIEKSTKDVVAIKQFKTAQDEQLSKREIQAISMLCHPYIVSYRHSFRHDGLLHLVFDWMPDSLPMLLHRYRRGVNPEVAQRIIFQLCLALQYCHANRVMHRDVKPDNILLDERGDIRLCDFGVARVVTFDGDALSDYVATRWYRPPEQELRMDRYSFDADIWSVGCVLMELLTGKPLFPGGTQIDQLNLIQEYLGPLPACFVSRLPRGVLAVKTPVHSFASLLQDRSVPDGTLDFVNQTLQLDPRQRLSASSCLEHPFLRPLMVAHRAAQHRRTHIQSKRMAEGDDGIEEELPGCNAEPKMPRVCGPHATDFKLNEAEERDGVRAGPGRFHRRRSAKSRGGDNNSDGETEEDDDDDIQEEIELDEKHRPVETPEKAHSDESPRTKPNARRRGPRHGCDPCEQEDYADDFEDSPS